VLASNQLHMVKLDISTTVWVWPTIPSPLAENSMTGDALAAQRASQPVAWMHRCIELIESAL
jgi:hypothetical protein